MFEAAIASISLAWRQGYFLDVGIHASGSVGCIEHISQGRWKRHASLFQRVTCAVRCALTILSNSVVLYLFGMERLRVRSLRSNTPGCPCHIVYVPTFCQNIVLITHPSLMRLILSHERNEIGEAALFSGGLTTRVTKIVLGNSLLSMDAPQHHALRAKLIGIFMRDNKRHIEMMQRIIKEWASVCIEKSLESNMEVSSLLPPLVVQAVCRCYLAYHEGRWDEIAGLVNAILTCVGDGTGETSPELKSLVANLDGIATEAATSAAMNKDFSDLSDSELLMLVKLMFFGGQDTTSALIEYIFHILGTPDYLHLQDEILHELQSGSDPKKLDSVLHEAIRIHPPSFQQSRVLVQAARINCGTDNITVPAGSTIHLCHLYGQRDQSRWGKDSDIFNPDRAHLSEPSSMYPFSMGPTACLGRVFMQQFVGALFSHIILNYRWQTTSKIESITGSVALKIQPAVCVLMEKR